jgi:hypothetical protein
MILTFDLEREPALEIRKRFRSELVKALQHKVAGLTTYQAEKRYNISAKIVSRLRSDPESIGIDKLLEIRSRINS